MRNSRAIKNLCIALEALSRIPGSDAEGKSLSIHALLDQLLTEEENTPRQTTTAEPNPDDEISL